MKLYQEYQKISNDLDFLKFCMTKVTMPDIYRALGWNNGRNVISKISWVW